MGNTERLGIDPPRVTRDEALELMLHHLGLAAAYFEAASDNLEASLSEARRILADEALGIDTPAFIGTVAFVRALHATYEAMKDRGLK